MTTPNGIIPDDAFNLKVANTDGFISGFPVGSDIDIAMKEVYSMLFSTQPVLVQFELAQHYLTDFQTAQHQLANELIQQQLTNLQSVQHPTNFWVGHYQTDFTSPAHYQEEFLQTQAELQLMAHQIEQTAHVSGFII